MPAPPPRDLLAQRYGHSGAGRQRRVVVVAALLGLLAVGWTAWVGWDHAQQEVSAQLRSYEVVGDTTTEVTVQIDRRSESAVECEVYAQADDHSRVGEVIVRVPPGEPGRVLVTETITTQRRAVNGVLGACSSVR